MSQARINWEGCVRILRKGIRHKNGEDGRCGGTNKAGWGGSPSGLLVHLPVLSSFCTRKSRMAKCTFWYWLIRVVPDIVQKAIKWL